MKEVSPMATAAASQSPTAFYHKIVYLQFCKAGTFMAI